MSFDNLPAELLTIIFDKYIRSEGHLEFLKNVIPVCETWRDIGVSSSSLCKIVDIVGVKNRKQRYLPEKELASVNWGLPVTTELSLTYVWLNMGVSKALFSGCPNLKSLSISDCRVHATTFVFTVRHCRKLESIALHRVNQNGATMNLCTLEPLFLRGGPKLKSVSMSNQMFRDETECADLVVVVLDNCPRLEQLKLSTDLYDLHWPRFPEEKLRTCCPKLRVLSVECYAVSFDSCTTLPTGGFQNLEVLELISLLHLEGFVNVLRNAHQLKHLILKKVNCNHTATNTHEDIVSKCLEKLHLIKTIFGEADLQELLRRWRHSLRELALDGEWYVLSDQVLLALVRGNEEPSCNTFMKQEQKPVLEVLNLCVPITDGSVLVEVVRECKRLRALDTSKCRDLPEEYRWKFDTIEEINALRDSLCSCRVREDEFGSENAS